MQTTKDKYQEILSKIKDLFYDLSSSDQVYALVELYESLYDGQKDEFLEETQN